MSQEQDLYRRSDMEEIKNQKRLVSYKVSINNLLKGLYIKEEGWTPNYIKINGLNVSRVNILGTVVLREDQEKYSSIMLDDGSGKIQIRSFDNNNIFQDISISDSVLIIGRIREFNNERYIIPEIARKIDQKWLKVRQIEIKNSKPAVNEEPETTAEEIVSDSPTTLVYSLIKELDRGQGAEIEEVLQKSKVSDAEKIIDNLLKEGEIFKTSPGRVKVL